MSHVVSHFLRFAVALCISAAGGFARADEPNAKPIYITNTTIVDVEKGELLPHRTVVIRGDKISRITDGATAIEVGAVVVQGKDQFLIPGLIDAHVHYVDPDTYGRLFIAHGVTFVRDMAGFTDQILAQRDRLNSGEDLGPEMIACGAIIDGKPPIWPFSEECDTPEEGRAAVKKLADKGVNQIKVYSNLKKDVYLAVVDEAHKRGLKAVGHVPEDVPLDEALKAGQDSCEHLTGFGAAVRRLVEPVPTTAPASALASHIEGFKAWQLMSKVEPTKLHALVKQVKDSGMVQCPTLVVIKGIGRMSEPDAAGDPHMKYVSPAVQSFWEGGKYGEFSKWAGKGVAGMQKMVGELHRAGVPLMVGTDLANPYVFAGFSVHDEMAMFQDAGIPAKDVLRAATIVPAKFCGVGERLGSIAEGKTASLVLLKANPLEDIHNTQQIAGVFSRGHYYSRDDLDGQLKAVRTQVKGSKSKTETVKLEVPGTEILRGKLRSTFQGQDSGDEDFVISQTDDGYHLMAHDQPKGGWNAPCVVKMHLDKNYALRAAEFRQQVDPPVVAHYVVKDGKVHATATKGKKALPEQILTIPESPLFAAPVNVADFVTMNACGVKIGETKRFNSVGFGFPDWRVQVTKMTVTRKEDTSVERGGKKVAARHYAITLDIPNMAAFTGECWTDERGVPLKSTMVMPFGKIGVTLD